MMDEHDAAIKSISAQVKSFKEKGIRFRVYHGATNSTRLSNRKAGEVLDISSLNHVLEVDPDGPVAVVEPNVPMDQLVKATLEYGLVPEVVPEFPGITVGGSYSGTAAESSSFRYGYFDRSVNWVDIVLADGEVVRASPDENSDLFNAAAGACGTFGIGVLFEIRLVKAAKYIELEYIPVHSTAEALNTLDELCKEPTVDFVDSVLFSSNSGVIVRGHFQDEQKVATPIVSFSHRTDQWYYLHAHSQIHHLRNTHCDTCNFSASRSPQLSESNARNLVPTFEYLFRYDRGAFWMGTYGQPPGVMGSMIRFFFDAAMRTRALYRAMHHSGRSQSFIIQDLAMPWERTDEFLTWSHDTLHIYPLWLCPINGKTEAPLHIANRPRVDPEQKRGSGMLMNIGLWGVKTVEWPQLKSHMGPDVFGEFVADNRAVEAKVRELGGLKWLYAHNFYTEDEFWSMYDREEYDRLRKKWAAEGLPSLWEKMRNTNTEYVHKGPFWRAALYTVLGRDYLLG